MTALLQVQNLEIKYHTREGTLTAIHGVSFEVNRAEIVGIVGESGCGKSTVASAVMRLLPPNGEISAGDVLFEGQNLRQLSPNAMRHLRGRAMSMIFQDPMTSLNPVFSVEQQMLDALQAHQAAGERRDRNALRQRAIEMLDRVGIPDAARQIQEYPHQFSGGMRQRIMIAMALLSNPALLIADEPTSALDVTLEAQIIDLIRGLRDELGTAILYITHDLGVVAQLCDRVIVMYAGSIVESGDVHDIFQNPQHPYTRALLRSHPSRNVRVARLTTIPGRVPSLKDLPVGCKFAPRCDHARQVCHAAEPKPVWVGQQQVLCFARQAGWENERPAAATAYTAADQEAAPESGSDASQQVVVETCQLRTHFHDHIALLGQILGQKGGVVRAVDGVDVRIRCGETLALVGESGSGKTTLGRTILRLENPTDGTIIIEARRSPICPSRGCARCAPGCR
jgi:peptide/nickel transport system ATP-binding protein